MHEFQRLTLIRLKEKLMSFYGNKSNGVSVDAAIMLMVYSINKMMLRAHDGTYPEYTDLRFQQLLKNFSLFKKAMT